jgi:hypothetical protein
MVKGMTRYPEIRHKNHGVLLKVRLGHHDVIWAFQTGESKNKTERVPHT